jgi:hypothetical protein
VRPRIFNGTTDLTNLQLLHGHCHDQKSALDGSATRRCRDGLHAKNRETEEPNAAKVARSVLQTSRSRDGAASFDTGMLGLSALASTVRQRAPQCPRHLCVGLFGRSDGINLGHFRRMRSAVCSAAERDQASIEVTGNGGWLDIHESVYWCSGWAGES